MKILKNYPLSHLNTFGIDAKTSFYSIVYSIEEIRNLLSDPELKSVKKIVLGGGSNILFSQDFPGLIIQNAIKGIEVTTENPEFSLVKAGAGENWHDFVCSVIEKGLSGVENLSLIPGCVGASPIQNIGAYGVELKDVFYELEAINLHDGSLKTFTHSECQFGYRDSIFKHEAKGKYIISSVTFKLSKKALINTSYGAIEAELKEMGITEPGIKDVSNAVIKIRRSKLPDPAEIGNAGSFFKNPEVPFSVYEKLKIQFPDLVAYKTNSEKMKLAAGWMIEQCGWKGKVVNHVGMHRKQALVLVNYGGASGEELIAHARNVQGSVRAKFGVEIEMEVNVV